MIRKQSSFKKRAIVSTAALAAVGALAGHSAADTFTPIAVWDFNNLSVGVNTSPTPSFPNPAPPLGSARVLSLGMTNNYADSNGIVGSVDSSDILSQSGSSDPNALNNTWRVRGPALGTTGNNNGWSLAAPQYTQGAEIDVSTVGRTGIKLSFDWFATNQGVRDLQEQYTTDGSNWLNINALQVANPNAFINGMTIDFTGITAVENNSKFGVRLVSAFDPGISGGTTYASATLVGGSPAAYNNNSGNWRFDEIVVGGLGTAVVAINPNLTWNPGNRTWNSSGTNSNWLSSGTASAFIGSSNIANFTQAGTGTVSVDAAGVIAFQVNVSNTNGTYTFTGGAIDGGPLTKTGAGNLVLSSTNNFTTTNVFGGTVHASSNGSLGFTGTSTAASAPVLLDNSATLVTDTAMTLTRILGVNAGGGVLDTGSNAVTVASFSSAGPFTKKGAGDLTFSGAVSGNVGSAFTLAGGNLIISATSGTAVLFAPTNTGGFHGNLLIAGAKVAIDGGIVDGTGDIELQSPNAILNINNNGSALVSVTINEPIKLNSLGLARYTQTVGPSGQGNVETLGTTAVMSGNANLQIANGVTGGGQALFIINSVNTYTGDTIINNANLGVVRAGTNNIFPATNFSFGNGTSVVSVGAFDLNGYDQTFASIATHLPNGTNAFGASGQQANGIGNSSTNLSTLTINGTSTTTFLATIGTPIFNSITGGNGTANNIAVHLAAGNTGTLILQGQNDYIGTTTMDGGTLRIDPAQYTIGLNTQSSLPLGNTVVNNAALIVNSDNTRASNISGSGTTTINGTFIASTGILVTPALTADTITQGALVNNGTTTVRVSGQIGPITGNGVFNVGDPAGSGTATVTVGRLTQSIVNVNNGAGSLLTIARNSGTSVIGALNVSAGSAVDVTNNTLLVNYGANSSPAAIIRAMLGGGYNGGTWNGTGITSTTAAAHPGAGALGYVDASEGVVVSGLSAGNVIVRYATYGDTALRGTVDGLDYTSLRNHFGATNATWSQGDFTYEGTVDGADYTLLRNNFGSNVSAVSGAQPGGGSSAASPAAPATIARGMTLTSPAIASSADGVSPAFVPQLTTPAAGSLALEVDPTNGHLYLVGNNTHFVLYQIASGSSLLRVTPADTSSYWNKLSKQSANDWSVLGNTSSLIAENIAVNETETLGVGGFFDLGKTAALGSIWSGANVNDLTFGWSSSDASGNAAVFHPNAQVILVPEPASLSLLALGAVGLLGRRRRKGHGAGQG